MMTVRSPSPPTETGRAEPLRQAGDQAHGRGRAERRQVVLIHLVAQARVADLVEAQELIETLGAAVRHDEPMEARRRDVSRQAPEPARSHRGRARRPESGRAARRGSTRGFVTRQLTGAATLPSSRFVSTVSMTVPSSSAMQRTGGADGPCARVCVASAPRSSCALVAGRIGAGTLRGATWLR